MKSNLGILIYDDAQPMDIMGPWEVFSFWKNSLNAPITMHLISELGSFVHCINNIVLKAHCDFDHSPLLDYLIVPGGPGRIKQMNNDKLLAFIREQSTHCKYILSDCTGMFLLYKAGLLKNKSVTTYWRALPELKSYPDIKIIEERLVKCGNIWTAGGVSSGIDLALALIAELAGDEMAGKVQLLFEYFPRRTIYCSEKTAQSLPAYGHITPDQQYLPQYIKDSIQSKDNE